MDHHRHQRSRIFVAILLAAAICTTESAASITEVRGTSSADEVQVSGSRLTNAGGRSKYTSDSGPEAGRSDCRGVPSEGTAADYPFAPPGIDPGAILVAVHCGGRYLGNRWVSPTDVVDVDAEARRLVERWVATVPVPAVQIGSAPPGPTYTGLETWFWVEGYRGEAITEQLDAFGHPVEVRIEPAEVRWSFGDGDAAASPGAFGEAYPARSSVTHVYEVRSTSEAAPDGAHDVRVDFDLLPRFRVDGGPWEQLDPISAGATAPLVVREIQAVITDQ